ncbi:hypothetical protein BZA05DRAFT_435735 [Tricharina praecox]|uniref:uncharacterized protein n=1 Tax=Tricharina praecox TaxID=43433 RepID=UPI00221E9189|nr:uncharacterized protein BZA05DRAFT_435735 [Tricharina praecox]KAI5853309.1 hypothetical protein BZA05DRAFT_435735 [Tricharina praecox]
MASDGLPYENLVPYLSTSIITLSTLAAIIVTGRMYGRMFLLRSVGWDDYCIVVAVLAALSLTTSTCLAVRAGTGRHYMIGTQISYCVCLGFARASLLLQLLRLAPSPKMRRFYWTLFALNALVTVITLSISVFKCPRRSGIHPEDVPAFIKSSCRVFFPIRFTVAVMGVVMDFRIRVPRRQRWVLYASFGAGGSVWVSSVTRMSYFIDIPNIARFFADPTYKVVYPALWTAIECNLAIICASIPCLHIVVKRVFPRILGTTVEKDRSSEIGISAGAGDMEMNSSYHSTVNSLDGDGGAHGNGMRDENGTEERSREGV